METIKFHTYIVWQNVKIIEINTLIQYMFNLHKSSKWSYWKSSNLIVSWSHSSCKAALEMNVPPELAGLTDHVHLRAHQLSTGAVALHLGVEQGQCGWEVTAWQGKAAGSKLHGVSALHSPWCWQEVDFLSVRASIELGTVFGISWNSDFYDSWWKHSSF